MTDEDENHLVCYGCAHLSQFTSATAHDKAMLTEMPVLLASYGCNVFFIQLYKNLMWISKLYRQNLKPDDVYLWTTLLCC